MPRIEEALALELARRRIGMLAAAANDEFSLVPEKTIRGELGWVFFYNSTDFIQSGNSEDALAGNGPIIVFFDGTVEEIESSLPLDSILRKIIA